jgi:membrane-associated phospholipid phosphatase
MDFNKFSVMLEFDYHLFFKINGQWTNSFLDAIFLHVREAEFWAPFYLFLLVFAAVNFSKKGWWWMLGFILTVTISDILSSHVIKEIIFRPRPCADVNISPYVRFIARYCPMSSSFTSSHACNHFAMAMFIFFTFKHLSKWWRLVFLWAALISYAQIYVGVHYPSDVACGAIVGSLIGYYMAKFFTDRMGLLKIEIRYS